MSNISTDFSTWSTTATSNQPDSGDTATVQSDLQRIQAAMRIILPNVNAALTPTHTELNYVDGVTSAIQTQLDSKATLAGGTFTGDITMNASSIITAEGADVASATTTNIWATDGNTRHITGNTTITSFGTAPQAGARMRLIFDGTPLLTHGANLNLNAGTSNIQIEAGDYADVYADTTTQFDVVVTRKSGQSITGALSAAVESDIRTGTDTAKYATANAINDAFGFSAYFQSTDQTITSAGTLTIAHGLARKPLLIFAVLKCTTAELNYSINDEVAIALGANDQGSSIGVSVVPDATNLNVRFGNAAIPFLVNNKTTGASANITLANWRLVLRAWA